MQLNKKYIVQKPWGSENWWAHTDKYVGKILKIHSGHRLSLQYHEQKDETIYVLEGKVKLRLGDEDIILFQGDSVHIKPWTVHRMEAFEGDAILVEVSTPEVYDVVRIQDDYVRGQDTNI